MRRDTNEVEVRIFGKTGHGKTFSGDTSNATAEVFHRDGKSWAEIIQGEYTTSCMELEREFTVGTVGTVWFNREGIAVHFTPWETQPSESDVSRMKLDQLTAELRESGEIEKLAVGETLAGLFFGDVDDCEEWLLRDNVVALSRELLDAAKLVIERLTGEVVN